MDALAGLSPRLLFASSHAPSERKQFKRLPRRWAADLRAEQQKCPIVGADAPTGFSFSGTR